MRTRESSRRLSQQVAGPRLKRMNDLPIEQHDAGAKRTRPARPAIPAWLMSVGLHSLIIASMTVAFRYVPEGIQVEPDRKAGITLVKHAEGEREYFDQDDLMAAEQIKAGQSGAESPFPDASEMAIDVSSLLPSTNNEGAGRVAEDQAASPRAGELGGGTAQSLNSIGGSARTEVFGVYGTGSRFVYVFDRSGSMAGFEGRPLRAAKRELQSSLGCLLYTSPSPRDATLSRMPSSA